MMLICQVYLSFCNVTATHLFMAVEDELLKSLCTSRTMTEVPVNSFVSET